DYIAEPLLSGVYGGDPRALSVNAVLARFVEMETKYGSLTRGALEARKKMHAAESGPLFRTFRRGLGSVICALATQLRGRIQVVHGAAEALERNSGGWRVRVGGQWIEAVDVIVATPAYSTAALLRPLDAEAARLLETIDYSSSMTIALVYRPDRIAAPRGF